jgi:hypothetical protein
VIGLRYKRVEDLGGDQVVPFLGVYTDQYDNLYRLLLWWRPSFWVFILKDPVLGGQRLEALASYWRHRREFLG